MPGLVSDRSSRVAFNITYVFWVKKSVHLLIIYFILHLLLLVYIDFIWLFSLCILSQSQSGPVLYSKVRVQGPWWEVQERVGLLLSGQLQRHHSTVSHIYTEEQLNSMQWRHTSLHQWGMNWLPVFLCVLCSYVCVYEAAHDFMSWWKSNLAGSLNLNVNV